MLYNFNQFINESKEDEFRSLKKGDVILYAGARYTVKSANEYSISLTPLKRAAGDSSNKSLKANLAQYKERGGGIIEKAKKEEDED